jgi:UDP-GlcNAc:undecaprenyl-phosphate GlcNAc-1-phosphate transferase
MRLGHGHRRSVFILWAWTALLSGFVLYPTYTHSGNAIVPIGMLALALLLYTVLHPRVRQTHRADTEAARQTMGEAEGAMATVEDPVPLLEAPKRRSP